MLAALYSMAYTVKFMLKSAGRTEFVVPPLDQLEGKNKRSQSHDRLRLATLEEGRAVQVMHVGPYSEEAPTIAAMHTFAESAGYKLVGKHHEIYLSDPRRTAPEKLRTVLRQPVA